MVMRFFRKRKRDDASLVDHLDNASSPETQKVDANADYPKPDDTAMGNLDSIGTIGMAAHGAQRLNDRVRWSHSGRPDLGHHADSPEQSLDGNRSMRVISSTGMARFSQRATEDSSDVMRRNSHPTDMWSSHEMPEGATSPEMTLRAKIKPHETAVDAES